VSENNRTERKTRGKDVNLDGLQHVLYV